MKNRMDCDPWRRMVPVTAAIADMLVETVATKKDCYGNQIKYWRNHSNTITTSLYSWLLKYSNFGIRAVMLPLSTSRPRFSPPYPFLIIEPNYDNNEINTLNFMKTRIRKMLNECFCTIADLLSALKQWPCLPVDKQMICQPLLHVPFFYPAQSKTSAYQLTTTIFIIQDGNLW